MAKTFQGGAWVPYRGSELDGVVGCYLLRFLPYLENEEGVAADVLVGYPNPNRGYGYGEWEEVHRTLEDASNRLCDLIALGIVDTACIQKEGCGNPLVEWKEGGYL